MAKKTADSDHEEMLLAIEKERFLKQEQIERKKEKLLTVGEKKVDTETGEIVKEYQVLTLTIKGTKEQLDRLGKIIKSSSIEVVKASSRETVFE